MKNIVIWVDVFIYSSFLLYTVFPLLAINVPSPYQYLHLEGSIKVMLLNSLRKISFSHLFIIENNSFYIENLYYFQYPFHIRNFLLSSLQIPIFRGFYLLVHHFMHSRNNFTFTNLQELLLQLFLFFRLPLARFEYFSFSFSTYASNFFPPTIDEKNYYNCNAYT